jgi:hypothetical protein
VIADATVSGVRVVEAEHAQAVDGGVDLGSGEAVVRPLSLGEIATQFAGIRPVTRESPPLGADVGSLPIKSRLAHTWRICAPAVQGCQNSWSWRIPVADAGRYSRLAKIVSGSPPGGRKMLGLHPATPLVEAHRRRTGGHPHLRITPLGGERLQLGQQ